MVVLNRSLNLTPRTNFTEHVTSNRQRTEHRGQSKLALGLFLEPTTRDVDEQAFPAPFAKSLLHEREHLSSETGLARSL